jgi:hypothetical protein
VGFRGTVVAGTARVVVVEDVVLTTVVVVCGEDVVGGSVVVDGGAVTLKVTFAVSTNSPPLQ